MVPSDSNKHKNLSKAIPKNPDLLISELLAILKSTLNDKNKLQNDYSSLKVEYDELKQKLTVYQDVVHDERKLLLDELRNRQYELHEKNIRLEENAASDMEQQRKYLAEVRFLTLQKHL